MKSKKKDNPNLEYNLSDGVDVLENDGIYIRCGEGFTAKAHDSGFPLSHDTYNGLYCASDGNIYYVLSSIDKDQGGKMYCYNPATDKISFCGDLTEVCGEKGLKAIPQGKNHVTFIETDGKLFFSTHIGYYDYDASKDMDIMGTPPKGYNPYPGGHLLSYDLKVKTFVDYGVVPEKEGVLSMNMDVRQGVIYGLTWPTGYFFRFDINKGEMKNFGTVFLGGENGTGENFRTICRSIAINPHDGVAYFSTSDGDIYKYNSTADKLEVVGRNVLKKDYFGKYNPSTPGHMGYHWRQIFWHEHNQLFYGVHGNSGYLFSFDPKNANIELVERLTSVPSRKSGMYDQFSYGYLGFVLGGDNQTIYYLTGAPIFKNGNRVVGKSSTGKGEAKGLEHLHLITYNLRSRKYFDHGAILFEDGKDPLYVNSITIGKDGTVYFLGRITNNGTFRTDLISFKGPFSEYQYS